MPRSHALYVLLDIESHVCGPQCASSTFSNKKVYVFTGISYAQGSVEPVAKFSGINGISGYSCSTAPVVAGFSCNSPHYFTPDGPVNSATTANTAVLALVFASLAFLFA